MLEIGAVVSNGQISKVTGTGTLLLTNNANSYAGFSEVQTLTNSGSASGTFTVTYRGETTSSIPATVTGAALQGYLTSLVGIGPGNVSVTGAANGPWTVAFQGTLANRDLPTLTVVNSGGANVSVAETTIGGGTLLSAGTIAVGANNALGVGGLVLRCTANNTGANLRTNTVPIALPNFVDMTANAGLNGYWELFVRGSQPIDFTKTVASHYNAGAPYLEMQNPSITLSGSAAGNAATDAAAVQSQLNGLATINAGGGSVSVVAGPGPYSFKVTFDGGPLAKTDVYPLTASGGGTAYTLARGGGAVIEQAAAMPLQKSGFGTLTLGGNAATTCIGVDSGASLVLNAQLGQSSSAANDNSLVKVGTGTLEFQGALPNTYFVSVAEDTDKQVCPWHPLLLLCELRVPRPNLFGRAGPGTFRNKNYGSSD